MSRIALLLPFLLASTPQVPVYHNGPYKPPQYPLMSACGATQALAWDGQNFSCTATGSVLPTPTDDNVLVGNGTAWAPTVMPSCTGSNSALRYSQGSNTFTCNTTIAAQTAQSLASDPTDCAAGQYATAIASNGNLTCSKPPDHLGSYVFGGTSPASYPANLQFARYKALNDGNVGSIHFVVTTPAASGTSGVLKLMEVGTGVPVCTLSVTCAAPAGTGFDGICGEGAGIIKAGNLYQFLWDGTTRCNVVQGGDADVVITEG